MSFFTDDVKPLLRDGASTVVIAQQVGCTVADVARIARSNGYRVHASGRLSPTDPPPDYGVAETPKPRTKGEPAVNFTTTPTTDPRLGIRALTTHDDKRIAKAAAKALAAYDALTDLVSEYEEKAQARADVERLERELAQAKAKLRPGKKQMDARWLKQWRIERARGYRRLVDPAPVRTHVEALLAFGMSARSIATAAGVSPSTVVRVQRMQYGSIQRKVAARLLSVRGPDSVLERTPADSETFMPALGARRRIQALLALGWTHDAMFERSGVRTAVTLNQPGEWLTVRKWRAVAELYETLAMTPGPSDVTRRRARRLGYLPPLAWDDDAIDRPDRGGDPGRASRGIDLDEVAWLEDQGFPLAVAAERLGTTVTAINKARNRKDAA